MKSLFTEKKFNFCQTSFFAHFLSWEISVGSSSIPITLKRKHKKIYDSDLYFSFQEKQQAVIINQSSSRIINFFQILWKSECYILDTFPSHLKKLRSILRFWLEKLNCGFFHSFHLRKTPQNNFSSQNFSVENYYFFFLCVYIHQHFSKLNLDLDKLGGTNFSFALYITIMNVFLPSICI